MERGPALRGRGPSPESIRAGRAPAGAAAESPAGPPVPGPADAVGARRGHTPPDGGKDPAWAVHALPGEGGPPAPVPSPLA